MSTQVNMVVWVCGVGSYGGCVVCEVLENHIIKKEENENDMQVMILVH